MVDEADIFPATERLRSSTVMIPNLHQTSPGLPESLASSPIGPNLMKHAPNGQAPQFSVTIEPEAEPVQTL